MLKGNINTKSETIEKLTNNISKLSNNLHNKNDIITLLKSSKFSENDNSDNYNSDNSDSEILEKENEINYLKSRLNMLEGNVINKSKRLNNLSDKLNNKETLLTFLRNNYIKTIKNIIPLLKKYEYKIIEKPLMCIRDTIAKISQNIINSQNINTSQIKIIRGIIEKPELTELLNKMLLDTSFNNKKQYYLNKIKNFQQNIENINKNWHKYIE